MVREERLGAYPTLWREFSQNTVTSKHKTEDIMLEYQYKKVGSIKEGVERLLTVRDLPIPEFEYIKCPEGELSDILILEGERIPLLAHRYEPRINAMHGYGKATPKENCSLNTISFVGKNVSLDALIYREMDITEHLLHARIEKITAFINGGAANILLVTSLGSVGGLELGATMAEGAIAQVNHRLITTHGCATDRTVNNVTEQSGVYLFRDDDARPIEYNDGEYYLFGLSVEESVIATYILAIIQRKVDKNMLIEQDKHLRELVALARKSSECGESVYCGGEGK